MALRWALSGQQDQLALFDPYADVEPRRELPGVEYLHVRARRIINQVPKASQMPFRHTINAYRGCSHACTYCFARPTHEYLGLDAGRDFEQRIVVKVNAVELVRNEIARPTWSGEHIAMGTNTDPYQPAEGRYRLTQAIVAELSAAGNPFSILTKSSMIVRDAELIAEARQRTDVSVAFSIATVDEDVWRATEPGTPPPAKRLEALARLTEAGVPCSVLVAPILPGISDDEAQIEAVVRACREAGAVSVSAIVLHLRPGVREQFMPWLESYRPELAGEYGRIYRTAYAPAEVRERIAQVVRGARQRARLEPGKLPGWDSVGASRAKESQPTWRFPAA
jgi:DNA repair photolyase